jgi:hypothetical protein
MRLLSGGLENVAVIAFLPGDLAARVPTLSTDVRIDGEYARKLWQKHRLGHAALGLVQTIIDFGWCTKTRMNQLDFLYVDGVWDARKHYVMGIKSAKGGRETWLTTLHPSNENDMRRRIRRAQEKAAIIRGPKGD